MNRIENGLLMMVFAAALLALMPAKDVRADAGSLDFKNYGALQLGIYQPTHDLDHADYDMGGSFGVAYGRYLTRNLKIEGGLNFSASDRNDIAGQTSLAGPYFRDDSIDMSSLKATLKAEVPLGPVKLYGGAGIDAYYVILYSEIDSVYLGSFDTQEEDTVLGFHIVLGGSYDITRRIFVGAEGTYRWTDDVEYRKRLFDDSHPLQR